MVYIFTRLLCILATTVALLSSALAAEPAKIYTSYFSGFVTEDPDRPGVAYEIIIEIFNLAGLDYQVIPLPWARAQHMAQNTPGALIFPLSWTKTRDQNYDWGVNIYNNQTHFITFNKKKLTADKARNKLIGVQLKSSYDNWLTEQGYKNLYRVPDDGSDLVALLANKRIDAWYTEGNIAHSVLKDVHNQDITYSDPIQTFRTFLATNKAAPYPHIAKLKAAMAQLRQSGKLQKILKKYHAAYIE